MTITKEQAERAEQLVRDLQRELNDAYNGVLTMPTSHTARVAYERADQWLYKPWA